MNPRLVALVGTALLGACGERVIEAPAGADVETRIRFYRDQIARYANLYPAWALLGEAQLAGARLSQDPSQLQDAERSLRRSIEIQPNFEAFRGMAALCCFRHRFDDGLVWAGRARECMPTDPLIRALTVEAQIGRGDVDAATHLLGADEPAAFYDHVARAGLQIERGDLDGAVEELTRAARRARQEQVHSLAQWALVRAAGIHLDRGQPTEARPYLEEAGSIDANDRGLQIHLAELDAAEARPTAALQRYERLLAQYADPSLHAAAAAAARQAGDPGRAEHHFDAARSKLEAALAEGEVFPLGALARLLADAGRDLDRARELARANSQFVHSQDARALLVRVESM